MIKEIAGALFGEAMGLAKECERNAMDLAKLEAAALYLKAVKKVRRQCLELCGILFLLGIMAAGIVGVPVAVIFLLPWAPALKLGALGVLGAVYLFVPLYILRRAAGEKRWMQWTRAGHLLSTITENNLS